MREAVFRVMPVLQHTAQDTWAGLQRADLEASKNSIAAAQSSLWLYLPCVSNSYIKRCLISKLDPPCIWKHDTFLYSKIQFTWFPGEKANKKKQSSPNQTNPPSPAHQNPMKRSKPNRDKRGRTDVNAWRVTRDFTVTFLTRSNHYNFYVANKQRSPSSKW